MNQYSKYISVKSTIEDLFGAKAWYALKETNSVSTWRKYIEKTLKAVQIAIHQTVMHFDKEWLNEINETIENGISQVKQCKEIDDSIAILAGTLIKVSFLQIGYMPQRSGSSENITLRKDLWNLNIHRSVVYLQSQEQKERYFWGEQQRELGVKMQRELHNKYMNTDKKLSYSEWCELDENSK